MLKKIFSIFNKTFKVNFIILSILITLSTILEFFGLFLIIPISSIIFEIDQLGNFVYLNDYISFFETKFKENYKQVILFLFLSIFIIKSLILVYANYYQANFFSNLTSNLNQRIIKNKLLSNYTVFNIAKARQYFQPITNETNFFVQRIITSILILISEVPILFMVTLLIMVEYIELTIFLFSVFLIVISIYYLFLSKILKRIGEVRFTMESKRLDIIFQIFSNMRDISLYKKYKYFFNIFSEIDNNYFDSIKKNFFISRLPRIILELIFIIIITILIFLIIKFEKNALDQIPSIAFVVAITVRLIPLFTKLIFAIQSLKYFEKSFTLIESELQVSGKSENFYIPEDKIIFEKEIKLKNISFGYDKKKVFENLNLNISKNSIIGVIGKSGSGKSTLLKLISGLVNPKNGEILVDNIELKKNDHEKLSNTCSIISGESDLINDTILKNIAFGVSEEDIDIQKIKNLFEGSSILEFITDKNSGKLNLNFKVSEQGKNLSDGQKQRVNIARALYFDREILILDEATNSLDNENEDMIFEILNELSKSKTIIIATHNKKNLRYCNFVYQIEDNNLIKKK